MPHTSLSPIASRIGHRRYAISFVPIGASALIVLRPAFIVGRSAAGTPRRYSLTGTTAAHDTRVFDFLKRRSEPKPKAWGTAGITFVGEQSGAAEDQFKRALAARFAEDPRVRRAYLVRVAYPTPGPQRATDENRGREGSAPPIEVLLCVAAPEDVTIVNVVGDEFRKLFHATQHMDTLFLTDEYEREVARVARPFYSATDSDSG